jgi:hypothetical protein
VAQHLRFGIYHRVRFAGQKNTPTRDGFFKDELPAKKKLLAEQINDCGSLTRQNQED